MRRTQFQNVSFNTTLGGALGGGDRGAFSSVPFNTGNPYDSNDFIFRWKQYVHLYEIGWEARKIVRIIPEDALRRAWLAEDIGEEFAKDIQSQLERMRFLDILKRSLILERLLGGCLTFMGLEGKEDEPENEYYPQEGNKLRFINAIPISRIARVTWDTNPLSEHYMRPGKFQINGQDVHISRCLVWDGEPLFDPNDFALTSFRGNLAGFGPSKLAPVWDDIVKAIGTRQAAYQMIQTNNAIIAAVSGLQDLQGTSSGRQALSKVKEIANQLSVYRAALIDDEKVTISSHAASFGSVPELILTFIQILSAASDIPATRFIGQAPGGLNATGESDLENYYNVIDSYQRQRIEPNVRRMYDVVGFNRFGERWKKERSKLTFKWPAMWNQTELEEAQTATARIENLMKLRDGNLISDIHILEEINAKGTLSVQLDETDLGTIGSIEGEGESGTAGQENPIDPQKEINKLRNSFYFRNADKIGLLIRAAGYDPNIFDSEQFIKGYKVEQEHADVTHGDPVEVAKIVLAHLTEADDYYDKLEKVENVFTIPEYFWNKLIVDAQEYFNVYFDLENNEPIDEERQIETKIDGLTRNINCHLCSAAGDWENPVLYFRCQIQYIRDKKTLGCFVFIPNKGQGNLTLWKDEKGKWRASDDEHRTEEKNDKQKCWDSLIKTIQSSKINQYINNTIDLDQLPEPTKKQALSGNYKKHHLRLHDLNISIENPKGSVRKGTDPDGNDWESTLPAHYGYIKRTEGADGDHVDVFIGPEEQSELVFVVDQNDLGTGKFDEHKVIFGCLSMLQAKELYSQAYSDGQGQDRVGKITPVHVSQFKQWLKEGNTKKPYANIRRKWNI